MNVRLSGKTRVDTIRSSGLSQFAVELVAADPVKYSIDTTTVSLAPGVAPDLPQIGRVYPRTGDRDYLTDAQEVVGPANLFEAELVNVGDYSTPPTITITGPVTNPQIELVGNDDIGIPSEFISVVITLIVGDSLEINTKNRTVVLNGFATRRGAMTATSSWFRIKPGLNTVRYTALTAPGNTSRAVVSMRSAWIG
jgi:hypothetical protein